MIRPSGKGGFWLALPAALIYLPLVLVPLGYSLLLSFHYWDGLAPTWEWAGLRHYRDLLADEVFRQALGHNVALLIVSIVGQLPVALGLAMLLRRGSRFDRLARTAIFVPYVLPTVVIALVWELFILRLSPFVLGSTTWSFPFVIWVISWRFFGFHMVLYLAGLAAIDPELEDAARLDGANTWQCFRHVTLPLLKPVIVVSVTLAVVGAMKYFDIVYVMTGGDPARSTELLATYMVEQGIDSSQRGYASALAVAITVLSGGGALAVFGLARIHRRASR